MCVGREQNANSKIPHRANKMNFSYHLWREVTLQYIFVYKNKASHLHNPVYITFSNKWQKTTQNIVREKHRFCFFFSLVFT